VALSGLEAMSNGIQFVVNEDFALVNGVRKRCLKLNGLWGILQRQVRHRSHGPDFLPVLWRAHNCLPDLFRHPLQCFSMQRPGVPWWRTCPLSVSARSPEELSWYWAYQILAVGLLAAASMTAFQDLQATEWRDVAIGEIPEVIVYRG